MIESLVTQIEARFAEVQEQMSDPAVISVGLSQKVGSVNLPIDSLVDGVESHRVYIIRNYTRLFKGNNSILQNIFVYTYFAANPT